MQRFMGPPLGPIPMQPFAMQQSFMQAAPMFGAQSAPFMSGMGASSGFGAASGFGNSLAGLGTASRSGGLLARLFGGGAASSAASGSLGLGQAAAGASSTMNFTTILTNTQRVLGLTQQVVPMVQQYGPLIRNMPTIWRIMRSKDSTSMPTTQNVNSVQPTPSPTTGSTTQHGIPITTPITDGPQAPISDNPTQTQVNTVNSSIVPNEAQLKKDTLTNAKQTPVKTAVGGLPTPKLYI